MIETIIITNKENEEKVIDKSKATGNILLAKQIKNNNSNDIRVSERANTKVVTSSTEGIGINRNIALYYSTGEICVLADDDVTFYDGYHSKIEQAYANLPQADIIIFDIHNYKNEKTSHRRLKAKRVRRYNYMRYGAARYTFRRESVLKHSINFNKYFGASNYGSGEDTLFLKSALDKNLKVYYLPIVVSYLRHDRKSSWFSSYDLKYFYDKGALFYAINPKFHLLLSIRYVIKMKLKEEISYGHIELFKASKKGADSFKNIK